MEEPLKEQETFQNNIALLNSKQKKKMITKIVAVLLLFTFLLIYLFCPLSQVKNSRINGNLNLTKNQVLEIAHLKKSDSLFFIDEEKCEELLNNHPLIESSKVKSSISGLSISINELTPLLNHDGEFYLNNGEILTDSLLSSPLVNEFLNEIILTIPNDLTSDLSLLTRENLSTLTSVYFQLTDEEKEKIEYFRFVGSNEYSFFYSFDDEYKFEIDLLFPENRIIPEDIAYGINSSSLKKYINVIKEYSFSKIDFKKNEDTLFKYYSIKVIIKYNDFGSSKVIYEVYNNDSQIEI